MMLQDVLQSAIDGDRLTPARVGPMRTAVKQFSAMFELTPDQLPPQQYHLPKEVLFRFIEQHSAADVGPRKLANTKNNIRWLLDLAVREGWLRPAAATSLTWKDRRKNASAVILYRARTDSRHSPSNMYALLLPAAEPTTNTPRGFRADILRQRQGLQLAPQALLDEINEYLDWCQKAYAPKRDAKIQKRAVSAELCRRDVLRIAGYAHHIAGIPLTEITLKQLTEPELVQAFVSWWVNERRGRVTISIHNYLTPLQVIARHWLKDPTRAEALRVINDSLSNDDGPVWDKEQSLAPLRMIEDAGLRNYPFTAERLQRHWSLRLLHAHIKDPAHVHLTDSWNTGHTGNRTGTQVMMSLIIRLLVRLPMRQRCIREMRLGHNLKQLPDGQWEVHFRGLELKIASRKTTGLNEYHHLVPPELTGLINEWLTFWRPRRLPEHGSDLVFMNSMGRPYKAPELNLLFYRAVYRFTGIRTTIHMVRDSWASDYLDATGDVSGCADMLRRYRADGAHGIMPMCSSAAPRDAPPAGCRHT